MLADAKGIGHSSRRKAPKSDGSISLFPSLFSPTSSTHWLCRAHLTNALSILVNRHLQSWLGFRIHARGWVQVQRLLEHKLKQSQPNIS